MGVANLFSSVLSNGKHRAHRVRLCLETLEAREVPALNPTGFEQEMLELLNRMRAAPASELGRLLTSTNPARSSDPNVQAALDYFGVRGSALASQWATLSPASPLAWHEGLMNSARTHNNAMIAADQQSHQLPGEAPLGTRLTQGGYSGWSAGGENIYAYATSVGYAHAGFAIDWGFGPNGIQNPAGHRINMMSPSFREVGIAVRQESNSSTQVGPFIITQDFGNRSNFGNSYLLGVAFNDANRNGRYDAGEGLGNHSVSITGPAGSFSATTMSAGGYQRQVPRGTYTITFSGPGLGSPISKTVTVGAANVKIDAIAGQGGSGGGGSGGSSGGATGNQAPVLNASYVATLTSIVEDSTTNSGNTVSSIVGSSITDPNPNSLKGIAVYSADVSKGRWEYSLNNGTSWNTLVGVSSSATRLLRDTDRIRFIPNANFNGSATITYRAWDRTTGIAGGVANTSTAARVGGSTAFSAATDSAAISVTSINDAPVLNSAGPFNLRGISASNPASNTGTLISSLLGRAITDVDVGAVQGIAVVGLTGTTGGIWQFSTDSGRTWKNFGATSSTTARLLRPNDYIRFVPNAGFSGQVAIDFRAWDQTAGVAGGTISLASRWGLGVGGSSAFSAAVARGLLSVAK